MSLLPFLPAETLKLKYEVFGHFYSINFTSKVVKCRSVLEIANREYTPADHCALSSNRPDAVFIMMNPGSSRPSDECNKRIRAREIHRLPISLVPAEPDPTQHQVMRVMHFRGWRHVRVLNLSDLRIPKMPEFFESFRHLENEKNFDSHSLFSDARSDELSRKFSRRIKVPLILAWGVNDKLAPLIERCMSRLPKKRKAIGLLKPGSANKYYHPLPRRRKDQERWVEQIIQQLEE